MSWVATAIIGSAVVGAYGAKKAGEAQVESGKGAIDEQRRQYDQTRTDYAPFRETGVNALADIEKLRGGDYSNFMASPDYQFRLSEGAKAIDRSGRPLSGAAVKEGIGYASNLASGEFGNYYNRLASQAGMGQTATGSTAAAGAGAAGNIGNAMIGQGAARASAYGGMNQAVQGGASNMMLSQYLNKPTGYQPTLGYGGYKNPSGYGSNYLNQGSASGFAG